MTGWQAGSQSTSLNTYRKHKMVGVAKLKLFRRPAAHLWQWCAPGPGPGPGLDFGCLALKKNQSGHRGCRTMAEKSKHKLIWLFVIKSGRTLGKLNDHAQGMLVALWSSVCWAGRKSLRPCAMTELLTAVNLKSRNPINRRQDYHVPEMCGRLKWLISLNNTVFIYSIKT